MASMQIDVDGRTAVVRYEVVGTRIFWNAVIRQPNQLLGVSVGGNATLQDNADPAAILRPAIIKALSATTDADSGHPLGWRNGAAR